MKKISIICPVYNGEKFLKECFDSVLSQTYQNWEVIIIDDGSTDNSPAICDEYVKLDSRFRCEHIINHGVSYARNYALSICEDNGYCFFLDCDDILPTDSLEFLMSKAEETDADMVAGERSTFTDKPSVSNNEIKVYEYAGEKEIYENVVFDVDELKPFSKKGEQRKINNGHLGCLYKISTIKDNGVKFLHTRTGEDLYFLVNFYMFCKRIIMTSKITYYLRMNPYSVTHNYIKNYYDDVSTCYTEFDKLYDNFPEDFKDNAKIGLNAWHYYRCRLAIEREISYAGGGGMDLRHYIKT